MPAGTMMNGAVGSEETRRLTPRVTAEQLVDLGRHLSLADRALLAAVYERGMKAAELARASGQDASVVARRIKRLVVRLGSPAFRYVARHKEHWPEERRAIAEA